MVIDEGKISILQAKQITSLTMQPIPRNLEEYKMLRCLYILILGLLGFNLLGREMIVRLQVSEQPSTARKNAIQKAAARHLERVDEQTITIMKIIKDGDYIQRWIR